MTRLFPKRPRPLAFHCPRDGPPPVLRAVLKTEVDPFWTPFQKYILDGPKNNGPSFFKTAKTTCVSLSPRRSPARFEGHSQTEVDPFWTPFQKYILDGPKNNGPSFFETAKTTCVSLSPRRSPARFEGRSQNRGRPVFSNGQVLSRFIVRQTGHDPFWKRANAIAFHRLSDGS
jgi:hypothetical protein